MSDTTLTNFLLVLIIIQLTVINMKIGRNKNVEEPQEKEEQPTLGCGELKNKNSGI